MPADPAPASDIDVATADRLLSTTRAVRKRLDLTRPVPPEVVAECVRLATQAPSAGDAQNWRWVALADPGRRRAAAAVYRAANEGYVRGALEGAAGAERRRLESVAYLLDHLHEVPVHVVAYGLEPSGGGGRSMPEAAFWGSIYPAVWSFQLALRPRGLGTIPLYVSDEAGLAAVVGAPPEARVAALLPVAYTTGTGFKPAARRPVDEVLAWDRWPAGGFPRA